MMLYSFLLYFIVRLAVGAAITVLAVTARDTMVNADAESIALPPKVYRRSEVEKHRSPTTGVWVTYKDGVYDVTEFLSSHPGGVDKLMMAAGGDLFTQWKHPAYQQHFGSPLVAELLEEMKIGTLHPDDVLKDTLIDGVELQYPTNKIYDCIVVGAGLSGLRCANLLTTQHGVKKNDVLVLEAQDYVGGRVRQV